MCVCVRVRVRVRVRGPTLKTIFSLVSQTFLKNNARDPVFFGFTGWPAGVDDDAEAALLDGAVTMETLLVAVAADTIWTGISTCITQNQQPLYLFLDIRQRKTAHTSISYPT